MTSQTIDGTPVTVEAVENQLQKHFGTSSRIVNFVETPIGLQQGFLSKVPIPSNLHKSAYCILQIPQLIQVPNLYAVETVTSIKHVDSLERQMEKHKPGET